MTTIPVGDSNETHFILSTKSLSSVELSDLLARLRAIPHIRVDYEPQMNDIVCRHFGHKFARNRAMKKVLKVSEEYYS